MGHKIKMSTMEKLEVEKNVLNYIIGSMDRPRGRARTAQGPVNLGVNKKKRS